MTMKTGKERWDGRLAEGDMQFVSSTGLWVPVANRGAATTGDVPTLQSDGTVAWVTPSAGALALDGLTDVDTTGVADGDVLTYDSGSGLWVPDAPTGGGGTAMYTIWDPLIPDASPHALTDEFTSNTIGSYTTVYGNGDSTTLVDIHGTRPGAAYFSAPSILYHQHSLLKALPAGDFAIFTAVRIAASGADATLAGLILATASTAGSGATMANVISRGSAGGGVQVAQTLAWNGFGSSASGAAGASAFYCEYPLVILRIRRVGTTVTRAHSTDGTTWLGEVAVTNAAWTHFGIFFQNYSGLIAAGSFEFLRYYSSGATLNTGASRSVYG